ncbi:3519_t:CDS:2, partial [Rhizophagus irregularis]
NTKVADIQATSINACINTLNRHLNQYSQILDGKLKDIAEQGKAEVCGSDSLSLDKVKLIFNLPILNIENPTGLLKTVFFYNVLFLGLRGGEHYILKFNDFKVKVNGSGIEVCIPKSKTNQHDIEGDTGDILKIQIISVYEKYFANRLVNASPYFYLQELNLQIKM